MQKQYNKRVVTILGSNGELGSQLANYLIKKHTRVLLVFRKGNLVKLKQKVRLNDNVQILEISTLFDNNLLEKILKSSKIVCNLTGLVSLSFSVKAYPHVLLINGVFPGLLARSAQKFKVPIVYASTQRMKIVTQRDDIKIWISKAFKEFNSFIDETNTKTNFENNALAFARKFLLNNPIPSGINIYELSKALGETMLGQSNRCIILRISSCYGPGCSPRRTIGRLVFSRLLGQSVVEKEEIRDFIYIRDLNEAFEKLINSNVDTAYMRYCCSGTNTSKSYIIKKITDKTPDDRGILKISDFKNIEVFRPSGQWFKNTLGRNPTNLDDGLSKTIKSFKKLYFSKNHMAITERLAALYDQLKQIADEQGVDSQEVEKIRNTFFRYHNGNWKAHEAFWKPTGLVLGYPFPETLSENFISRREKILAELGLSPKQYWLADKDSLHVTVISYSHYSESGTDAIPLPLSEIPKAKEIIGNYIPIKISFCGTLVTNNGSLLVKGFVDNEALFLLRGELMSKIDGIIQQPQNLVHLKLAQILYDVPYELTEKVNRLYSSIDFGSHVFNEIKTPQGEVLRFRT